jgi:plasmid stabilization system protein ParE
MKVFISAEAERDQRDIIVWTADRYGLARATAYADGLARKVLFLGEFPFAAAVRDLSGRDPIRVTTYKAHLILYRISNSSVLVLRIVDARRNWAALLP